MKLSEFVEKLDNIAEESRQQTMTIYNETIMPTDENSANLWPMEEEDLDFLIVGFPYGDNYGYYIDVLVPEVIINPHGGYNDMCFIYKISEEFTLTFVEVY